MRIVSSELHGRAGESPDERLTRTKSHYQKEKLVKENSELKQNVEYDTDVGELWKEIGTGESSGPADVKAS